MEQYENASTLCSFLKLLYESIWSSVVIHSMSQMLLIGYNADKITVNLEHFIKYMSVLSVKVCLVHMIQLDLAGRCCNCNMGGKASFSINHTFFFKITILETTYKLLKKIYIIVEVLPFFSWRLLKVWNGFFSHFLPLSCHNSKKVFGLWTFLWCHQPMSVVMTSFSCGSREISHMAFMWLAQKKNREKWYSNINDRSAQL